MYIGIYTCIHTNATDYVHKSFFFFCCHKRTLRYPQRSSSKASGSSRAKSKWQEAKLWSFVSLHARSSCMCCKKNWRQHVELKNDCIRIFRILIILFNSYILGLTCCSMPVQFFFNSSGERMIFQALDVIVCDVCDLLIIFVTWVWCGVQSLQPFELLSDEMFRAFATMKVKLRSKAF